MNNKNKWNTKIFRENEKKMYKLYKNEINNVKNNGKNIKRNN